MANVSHNNLEHVLLNNCTDNDCELHHIEVAAEEQVITETDLAFWFAGVAWANRHSSPSELNDLTFELARTIIRICLLHLEENPRTVETDLLEDR